MKIAHFALTGYGNHVLTALSEAGRRPQVIVTRSEPGPFPYYPCVNIGVAASEHGIPVMIGEDGERFVADRDWDLILVSGYHRVLSEALLGKATHAINLHPSLLPKYRGANPFFWALHNKESETGVSAHKLTSELDQGEIYGQLVCSIGNGWDENRLRRELGELAARLAVEVVKDIAAGTLVGTAQDESQATYCPPRGAERELRK
jgi:methionyl-tRNA formyltransferase